MAQKDNATETNKDPFLKRPELLEEWSRADDLLDFSKLVESLSGQIDQINKSSMIIVVAPYGTGKSTLLEQLKEKRIEEAQKTKRVGEAWVLFDAWKYPDKKELWEGFTFDSVKKLLGDNEFKKTFKAVTGSTSTTNKGLCKTLAALAGALGGAVGGVGVLLGNLVQAFLKTSPATRLFQIQKLLQETIKKSKAGRINIIVEDIDRSGDYGLFFLETLKQFIEEGGFGAKTVTVLVPVAEEQFDKESARHVYQKCADYIFDELKYFKPDLRPFLEEVYDPGSFTKKYEFDNLATYLQEVFKKPVPQPSGSIDYQKHITMRLLKQFLRTGQKKFQQLTQAGFNARLSVCIAIEASKYYVDQSNKTTGVFDTFLRGTITKYSLLYRFLIATNAEQPLSAYLTGNLENNIDLNISEYEPREDEILRLYPGNILALPKRYLAESA